jgi:Predicted NTPase (NACHT family)
MKQITLLQKISDLLLQFSNEVKDKGKLKLNDINIIAEDILLPILSIAYDTDLINLNNEKANYPGIDLASNEHVTLGSKKNKKIAFQITSTNNIEKIKKTLNGFVKKEFYKKFDQIYIFNLIEKQNSYQKDSIEEVTKIINNKFKFDLGKNIIDKSDLNLKIKNLSPLLKIEKIHKLLEDQFVYKKKSLLSLEIWESDGKLGYGFSNLLNSIDLTTYSTLIKEGISNEAGDLLHSLLINYSNSFAQNYENKKTEKFKNLGFNTYLKAGFDQALNSFLTIKDKLNSAFEKDSFCKILSDSFCNLNERLDDSDFPLINQPTNHPAILFIKTTVLQIFSAASLNDDVKDLFIKDFNENIQHRIIKTFGDEDYLKHQIETKEKWLKENETELLIYMRDLAKLGFVEGENLQYQETFGIWQDIREFGLIDEEVRIDQNFRRNKLNKELKEVLKGENNLKKVETLIEEYFDSYKNNQEGYLNNILFLIADFGKGKTSFLHYFASKLAKQYLKTQEGLFPIYINLNEYDKFANSPSLGVISNYLAKRFRIDIKNDYFKKKNYLFLVDSLDECGKLTEVNIEKVIKDVAEIQNLDNINQRNNRLIIASRPIAKGLKEQITRYKPYIIKSKNEIENTENYISVYGFRKDQFDSYIEFALKKYFINNQKKANDFIGFSKKIMSQIENNEHINLYAELYETVLKESELKRPIFAYMIYKLIISNSNFIDFGKVGVYISFLNHLSRDAKHKDDCNHKVSLKDEFVYRNILHASALLWQYKRQSGEQTSLTKADICRTIEEKEIDKDDRKVLGEFKDIESVHFLSHSYLGEKENTLHFQHQSFAEILLAEYYMKVFIKYAIEENSDVEDARIRLSIGLPTDQTIDFFKGLLVLLKECALGNPDEERTYSKRELLIPLLASMAIKEHNKKLYSNTLYYTWFKQNEDDIFSNNKLNDNIIRNFPITKKVLDKIELLCYNIIDSKKTYFLDEPSRHTILFKDELIGANNVKNNLYDIDKWFALIAGNITVNDISKEHFFNSKVKPKYLFELLKNWSNNYGAIPYWGRDLFMGINMENVKEGHLYEFIDASHVNFSNSFFKNLSFKKSELRGCNFANSTFDFFSLQQVDISFSIFDNIKIRGFLEYGYGELLDREYDERVNFDALFDLTFCFIAQGVLFPAKLNDVLKNTIAGIVNQGSNISIIDFDNHDNFITDYFLPLRGLFKLIIQKGKDAGFIVSSFKFEEVPHISRKNKKEKSKGLKEQFEEFIINIEKEVKGIA